VGTARAQLDRAYNDLPVAAVRVIERALEREDYARLLAEVMVWQMAVDSVE
jgi:hypothetical protein